MGYNLQVTTYAPYIEEKHKSILNTVAAFRKDLINDSPYTSYKEQDTDSALLGVGYAITDFSALYDMFGKFMSGYDLEALWDITSNQIQVSEIDSAIKTAAITVNDTLENATIPELKLAMRENNSVISSSFIIAKANIERKKLKALLNISTEVNFKVLLCTNSTYNAVLNRHKEVIDSYAEIMKFYYTATPNADEARTRFKRMDAFWPFTVMEFERAILGTMQGTSYDKLTDERERSTLSKCLLVGSYTAQGAYLGAHIGGPWGAFIGGCVGFAVGLAVVLFE